jgi:hypothetical protein
MTPTILSITGNKGMTAYKVTIHAHDWLTIKFFTYWPKSNRLTAPKVRLGKFYHPIFEIPISVERELCQQIQEFIQENPEIPTEDDSPDESKTETVKEPPISVALIAAKRWDTLKRSNGTFWKRERIDDEKRGPLLEIAEAEYMSLQSLDAPLEPPTEV